MTSVRVGRVLVTQQLVDRRLGPGPRIDLFHDDRAIEVHAVLGGHRPRHDNRSRGHFAISEFASFAIHDLGGLTDEHAHAQHRPLAHDTAFDHFGAGADKAVVLDDGRTRLHRLQHAADAHAARQVHVLADLRAGSNSGPGIHHGALVHIGAQVHKRRHQNHARRNKGRLADDTVGDSAEARSLPLIVAPALELAVDLVPPAAALRTAILLFHVLDAKTKQHSLFGPLVHMPAAIVLLLRHAQAAAIKGSQSILNRIAGLSRGGGRDGVTRLPGGFNGGFKLCVGHLTLPENDRRA
mmetsp:Transcript_18116/g.28068  ORF Transcript_18116/g.28068 Transcript_18116/m.28068 type:complete len:296 (-) Transcript_18116:65-952(-)